MALTSRGQGPGGARRQRTLPHQTGVTPEQQHPGVAPKTPEQRAGRGTHPGPPGGGTRRVLPVRKMIDQDDRDQRLGRRLPEDKPAGGQRERGHPKHESRHLQLAPTTVAGGEDRQRVDGFAHQRKGGDDAPPGPERPGHDEQQRRGERQQPQTARIEQRHERRTAAGSAAVPRSSSRKAGSKGASTGSDSTCAPSARRLRTRPAKCRSIRCRT